MRGSIWPCDTYSFLVLGVWPASLWLSEESNTKWSRKEKTILCGALKSQARHWNAWHRVSHHEILKTVWAGLSWVALLHHFLEGFASEGQKLLGASWRWDSYIITSPETEAWRKTPNTLTFMMKPANQILWLVPLPHLCFCLQCSYGSPWVHVSHGFFPGKHRIVSTSSQFGISTSVFGDK